MKQKTNMLSGPILINLTKLALPIMATSLIQMAYNMVDMIWIGEIGSIAVAAVGAAGMYMWLANGLSTLSKTGGQIKVGHSLGAGQKKQAGEYAAGAIWISIVLGAIISLCLLVFADPLIRFLGLNETKTISDGTIYLKIVSLGVFFSFINQVLTGILTSMGNTKVSFQATAVGLVINMILDPILIFGYFNLPKLEVAGAAIATVIAQGVVMVLLLIACKKDKDLFPHVKLLKIPVRKDIVQIIKIGLPISIQSMVFTGISMVISRMIAKYGDNAVAVQKVGSQIESISWMTAEGFSAAVNAFVAQNHGANNRTRVKKGYQVSMGVVTIWGIFSTALLVLLPGPIFQIFLKEKEVYTMGVQYLQILGLSQLFMCLEIATQGAFSGLGKTIPPSVVGIVLTAARIPLAAFLCSTALGLNGIWVSISVSSILKGMILMLWFVFYLRHYQKQIK